MSEITVGVVQLMRLGSNPTWCRLTDESQEIITELLVQKLKLSNNQLLKSNLSH